MQQTCYYENFETNYTDDQTSFKMSEKASN